MGCKMPDLMNEIRAKYQKLLSENKLISRAKLKDGYDVFSRNFGPERLKSMDGEALLEAMFNHGNRASLVYWLEFKSDEEFQTSEFGGIAGGSAFKFGIFKRKDDGKWISGSSQNIREISIADAVLIAREKRDLLVKGADIIAAMLVDLQDETYLKLQQSLDRELGSLADTAWVHKYYHLLFPDKIDDYHAPWYQRFYLIKMLEKPISEKGRYALAGQYMRIAQELDMPIHHLTTCLWRMYGSVRNYWRVGTTNSDGTGSFWDIMLRESHVSIGWHDLGDLSNLDPVESKAREQIKGLLNSKYPSDPRTTGRSASQILQFLRSIKLDDIVLAANGQMVLGIGTVTGSYEYKDEQDYPHSIKVQWLHKDTVKLTNASEGLRTTVYQIENPDNLLDIEKILQEAKQEPTTSTGQAAILEPLYGIASKMDGILRRKKQVILYGPPGTGKTYLAENVCLELAARKAFNKSFASLSENESIIIKGSDNTPGLVRMCCFHPSFSYEDFVEGIKPSVVNNQTLFELKPGVFKLLCEDASRNPEHSFFLIVDEINRGDISRIFGELITIIEAGKRGKPMLLPQSNTAFIVPANVFLVGTMNTADRSIALLDVALRRRFGFIELMPDYSLLSEAVIEGLPLGMWLEELNKRVREFVGRDARNLQIGHSYFMEDGHAIRDFGKLQRIINEDILPLIEEYCYGDYATIAKIIGNGLVDISNQLMRHELFSDSRKSDLLSALLETCPDITTSSAVKPGDELLEEPEGDEALGELAQ